MGGSLLQKQFNNRSNDTQKNAPKEFIVGG